MQINCLIVAEGRNEYTTKKGERVSKLQLSCLDQDTVANARLINTFDLILDEEEGKAWAGKALDKKVLVGVTSFEVFSGRLRAKGHVLTPVGK